VKRGLFEGMHRCGSGNPATGLTPIHQAAGQEQLSSGYGLILELESLGR
jgi:hypothetical protein